MVLCIQGDVPIKREERGSFTCSGSCQLPGHWKECFGLYFLLSYCCITSWGYIGLAKYYNLGYMFRFWNQRTEESDLYFALWQNPCHRAMPVWGLQFPFSLLPLTTFHHDLYNINSICGFKVFIDDVFWCTSPKSCLWLWRGRKSEIRIAWENLDMVIKGVGNIATNKCYTMSQLRENGERIWDLSQQPLSFPERIMTSIPLEINIYTRLKGQMEGNY